MEEVHRGGSKNKGAWPVGLGKGYRGKALVGENVKLVYNF